MAEQPGRPPGTRHPYGSPSRSHGRLLTTEFPSRSGRTPMSRDGSVPQAGRYGNHRSQPSGLTARPIHSRVGGAAGVSGGRQSLHHVCWRRPGVGPWAALFSWPAIAVFGVLGLIGIILSHRTGFPAAGPIPAAAIVLGLAIGVVTVLGDLAFGWTSQFAQQHPLESFNVPFPGSVLFYTGGAIESEVLFRLLPIPLVLWLISSVVLKGRRQSETFWVLAMLTSFIEPALQDLLGMRPETVLLSLTAFVPDYALNFSQAAMFRRFRVPGGNRAARRVLPGVARRLRQLHLPMLSIGATRVDLRRTGC